MGKLFFFALSLLVYAQALAADAPIPQDAAQSQKRHRERLEWNRRTLQGAYDKVGKRNPRWDESARKAMELAAWMFSEQVDPELTTLDLNRPAQTAIDAGCDDPLLVYLYNRSLVGPKYPGPEEVIRRIKVSAKALAASHYPVIRRAVALQLAGNYGLSAKKPGAAPRQEAEQDLDAALALLPKSVAEDERNEFWEDRWFDTLNQLITSYRSLGLAAPAAYERVDSTLAKLPEMKVLRLLLRGNFWSTYGWEARTTAFAPNVPQGGFEAFEQRLAIAREALEQAWKLHPGDGRVANYILDIEKAVGGDHATMELWFERAMKADSDKYSACLDKLDWLDPKWHGSFPEMLAFGRACRDTKNWWTGISLLVGDAHLRYGFSLAPTERIKYMRSPEVWSDIESVYNEYLKHHPNNDVARSKYAALCYLCSHYREAHVQFQALGDRLTVWPIFPNIPMETLQRMRDDAALKAGGQQRGANAGQVPK